MEVSATEAHKILGSVLFQEIERMINGFNSSHVIKAANDKAFYLIGYLIQGHLTDEQNKVFKQWLHGDDEVNRIDPIHDVSRGMD